MRLHERQHGVQERQFLEFVRARIRTDGAPNIRPLDELCLYVRADFVRPRLTVVISLRYARVLPRHFGDVARVERNSCDDQERLNLKVERAELARAAGLVDEKCVRGPSWRFAASPASAHPGVGAYAG